MHYPVPINPQLAYEHLCCPDCTQVAHTAAGRVMSLPMHPYLTQIDICVIAEEDQHRLSELREATRARRPGPHIFSMRLAGAAG